MKRLLCTTLLTLLVAITPAAASVMDFTFTFSGAAYDSNSAVATGAITFDSAIFLNPGRNLYDPSGAYIAYGTHQPGLVTALTITVSGSTLGAGDGTFTLSDFDAVLFDTSLVGLNLSQQLVDQPLVNVGPDGETWNWGSDHQISTTGPSQSYTGDFQIFAKAGSIAPSGIYPYQLGTNAGGLDGMQLTSFAPVNTVPEPSTYLLLTIALGAVGYARRRIK